MTVLNDLRGLFKKFTLRWPEVGNVVYVNFVCQYQCKWESDFWLFNRIINIRTKYIKYNLWELSTEKMKKITKSHVRNKLYIWVEYLVSPSTFDLWGKRTHLMDTYLGVPWGFQIPLIFYHKVFFAIYAIWDILELTPFFSFLYSKFGPFNAGPFNAGPINAGPY